MTSLGVKIIDVQKQIWYRISRQDVQIVSVFSISSTQKWKINEEHIQDRKTHNFKKKTRKSIFLHKKNGI